MKRNIAQWAFWAAVLMPGLFNESFNGLLHAQMGMVGPTITCQSNGRQKVYCKLPASGPVNLQRQMSGAACMRGSTWGVDNRGLWVSGGCQGVFVVSSGPVWSGPGPGGGPPGWPPSGNWNGGGWNKGGACFYKSYNFTGDQMCMRRGESFPSLGNFGGEISSIRVFGGARVVVYNDRNYSNGSEIIRGDAPDLRNYRFRNGHTWNNRISSIQVQ